MNWLELPLVESLINQNKGLNFSRVKIIGVQHILETTHSMFRSFYKLGLKPENVAVLGKCYSTCEEVFNEMIEDGILVNKDSFYYSSYESYDETFTNIVKKFIESQIENISSDKCDEVIVLDDGGKCIEFLSKYNISKKLVAIEQTSSGYEAIKNKKINFPVINVARSPVKLNIESPMIAQAASERLFYRLKNKKLKRKKALIIGAGAIGNAMKKKLSDDMQIDIFDIKNPFSLLSGNNFCDLISKYSLIIGCTGKTSINSSFHDILSPGTILVSISSSDREFDSVFLRKKIKENNNCHEDLLIDNILLVNSGFPVNFDGDRENIDPYLIQLTIALIAAGIIQSFNNFFKIGINPLDDNLEKIIQTEFAYQRLPDHLLFTIKNIK